MAQETETPAMELAMASCTACDLVFMASERRQTCPTCGGEAVGPYFEFILDESGLHQKDGVIPDIVTSEEPLPEGEALEAPLPASPVEETAPAEEEETNWCAVFAEGVAAYLQGGGITEDDLHTVLVNRLGAEKEDAVTAVGRIMAVRVLLCDLAGAGLEPVVEVEVEVRPEDAPEPSPAPDNGAEAV